MGSFLGTLIGSIIGSAIKTMGPDLFVQVMQKAMREVFDVKSEVSKQNDALNAAFLDAVRVSRQTARDVHQSGPQNSK